MVAQSPCRSVAANNRKAAYIHCVIEALLPSVGQVNHYAAAVHFPYDLFAVLAHPAMLVAGLCRRVADVVVSVVAKRDVNNAFLSVASHIVYVLGEGVAVFYGFHYGVLAFTFQAHQVCRCPCEFHALRLANHFVYLLEYSVRHAGCGGERSVITRSLRNVGSHYRSVETAFVHLVEVNEYLRVAATYVNPLRKEHRRVAMGIEREV